MNLLICSILNNKTFLLYSMSVKQYVTLREEQRPCIHANRILRRTLEPNRDVNSIGGSFTMRNFRVHTFHLMYIKSRSVGSESSYNGRS